MTDPLRKVLIIGGDSVIGGALGAYLEARGVDVLTTTRRDNPGPRQISLDLSAPSHWPTLPNVDCCSTLDQSSHQRPGGHRSLAGRLGPGRPGGGVR